VWSLLTDPARCGDFFDVRITRVQPAGSAVVGQQFFGDSGPSSVSQLCRSITDLKRSHDRRSQPRRA
jgi:hypothetical protein